MESPTLPPPPPAPPSPPDDVLALQSVTDEATIRALTSACAQAALKTMADPALPASVREWIRARSASQGELRKIAQDAAPLLLLTPELAPWAGRVAEAPNENRVNAVRRVLAAWHGLPEPALPEPALPAAPAA